MPFHPTGITVEIVGTESNTQGRSCEEHDICGSVMAEDVVVRFRKVQILVNGKEESSIAAYHVSDGIDRCRVGLQFSSTPSVEALEAVRWSVGASHRCIFQGM